LVPALSKLLCFTEKFCCLHKKFFNQTFSLVIIYFHTLTIIGEVYMYLESSPSSKNLVHILDNILLFYNLKSSSMVITSALLIGKIFPLTLTTPTFAIFHMPFHIVDFYWLGRKTGQPGEKPSWHEGERRWPALSPLDHPCHPRDSKSSINI